MTNPDANTSVRLGVDIGGTFTDVVLEIDARLYSTKILTTYAAPENAILEGIASVCRSASVEPSRIDTIVHGTTLATNALIERRGANTALVTTKGFRDVIEMRTESRFEQYDLNLKPLMDIQDIMRLLPHRPPFLLIDRILELSDSHVVGMKNVTMNESFFVGHFPDAPVMPGVLQVEAMAQCGGILVLSTVPDPENYLTYFMKMNNVKFKQKVLPGDTLIFKAELMTPIRRGICHMQAYGYANNKLVVEAELMAQIVKKP